MPFTGFDPLEPGGPIDVSGGGMDPSYNWNLAPGGRFPGDDYYYLEYLANQGRGGELPQPGYEAPGTNLRGILGWLARFHQSNVRAGGGPGNVPDPYFGGGYPYQLYSGPGAPYGPNRGLIDMETGNFFDGPEYRPPGSSDPLPNQTGGGRGGGGHKYTGPTGWGAITPAAPKWHPSFVDWQPGNTGPVRMTGGGYAPAPQPTPPAAPRPGRGGGGGGGGRGIGAPAPTSGGTTPTRPGQTAPTNPAGGTDYARMLADYNAYLRSQGRDPITMDEMMRQLRGGTTPGEPAGHAPGPARTFDNGGQNFRGYDTNNLDRSTPGWMNDPTAGVYDTSGMPGHTLLAPNPGESVNDYIDRMHNAGFQNEEIIGAIHGFGMSDWNVRDNLGQNRTMDNAWDWGAGPVVRDANPNIGYHFANQVLDPETQNAWNMDPETYRQHLLGDFYGQSRLQNISNPNQGHGVSDSMREFMGGGSARADLGVSGGGSMNVLARMGYENLI